MIRNWFFFDTVSSTNKLARSLWPTCSSDWSVLAAATQTAGKGKGDRKWFSEAGGLYFSLGWKQAEAARIQLITLATAYAVCQTIRDLYHLPAVVKWPNDVMINDKKVCGVLIESSWQGRTADLAVGIGINLRQDRFPDQITVTATSLTKQTNAAINVDFFLQELLGRLAIEYDQIQKADRTEFVHRFKKICCSLGRQVKCETIRGQIQGRTTDITTEGGIVLQTGKNQEIVWDGDLHYI